MFRNEEIRDSKRLATLNNQIKERAENKLGILLLRKKVKNLRAHDNPIKRDQAFLRSFNLLRISAN